MGNNRKILVIGGGGAIGSGITELLLKNNYAVMATARDHIKFEKRLLKLNEIYDKNLTIIKHFDSTNSESVIDLKDCIKQNKIKLSGLIYVAGTHRSGGGFMDEIQHPLSRLPAQRWHENIATHVTGFFNCFRHLVHHMDQDSHIVAISSAVTRITDENCPEWLYAGHYAVAKKALDEFITWARRDPAIKKNNILIHRLAPSAVDSPFHDETPQDKKPQLVSIKEVAEETLAALRSSVNLDKLLLPKLVS